MQEVVDVVAALITIFTLIKIVKKANLIIRNQRRNKSKMKKLKLWKRSC